MRARPHLGSGTDLASWSPEPVSVRDELPAAPAERLAAVLGAPLDGAGLPPLWHWMYFLDWPAQHELGADGHPKDGHFLPPVPDRRRMFAGGRVELRAPLQVGTPATRVSSLHEVVTKQGSTGELVFVTVRHEISQRDQVCVVEETDAVYRSGEDPRRARVVKQIDTGSEPRFDAAWQSRVRPDPALLFRFSALTANAHRIHYDAPYAQQVEGYPGLVVHGPLLALLMAELVRGRQPEREVGSLAFRFRRPVFAGEQVVALGDPDGAGRVDLRIGTAREPRHATAELVFD